MGHHTTPHREVANDTPSGEIGSLSFIYIAMLLLYLLFLGQLLYLLFSTSKD
jgi:hypothetical protein